MSSATSPPPSGLAHGRVPGQGGSAASSAAVPRMVRQRRRRPALIALSVALIAGGGLAGAVLYTASRTEVVVVARDVPVGSLITREDLRLASVALDPGVSAVPAGRVPNLVGERAAVDLTAGALLSPAQVTRHSLVGSDQQVVGVALKPSQVPATPLSPGERVLVVSTPDPNTADAAGRTAGSVPPQTLGVTVVAVGQPQMATGQVTVDVAVDAADGPTLAARAATGNVALVVAARGGG